jgi:hypothetical protein
MNYIESLVQAESVGAIPLDQSSIPSVQLYPFLEVYIQRHALPIVRRHKELLAFKFIPDYLWRPTEAVLFQELFALGAMGVFINLLVDERRGERVSKGV